MRCEVGYLLGGRCGGDVDPHGCEGVDGGVTVCAEHMTIWPHLRRELDLRRRPRRRCRHRHATAEARAQCERRLARAP